MQEAGGQPCDEAALADAETRLGTAIPPPIRAVYAAGNGRYNTAGQWWVVWPLGRLVQDNVAAWNDGLLPRDLLAFGDDGAGNPFVLRLDTESGDVARWNYVDDALETSEGSMEDFLREWLGPS